ncbi:hypothetical protein [Halalkalibacter oceani]|uniref:hypothetical protein n=1 Tax=Halalkalibacter oceani TaxID=1653776 RepID=UPI0033957047
MSDFITFTLIGSLNKQAIRKDSIIEFHEEKVKIDGVSTPCVKVIYQANLSEKSVNRDWVRVTEKYEDILALFENDQPCSIQGFKGDGS